MFRKCFLSVSIRYVIVRFFHRTWGSRITLTLERVFTCPGIYLIQETEVLKAPILSSFDYIEVVVLRPGFISRNQGHSYVLETVGLM